MAEVEQGFDAGFEAAQAGDKPAGRRRKRGQSKRGAETGKQASATNIWQVGKAPTFLKRDIPYYDFQSEEALTKIEDFAERILSEVGIEFRGDEEAIRLFKEAGATVKGERLTFDKGLVKSLCATAPREFVQHARNPERSTTMGGDKTCLAPVYGPPFVRTPEGERRYGTIEDFRNFVRLVHMIPWFHHGGGVICEPCDVPVNKRHLDMAFAHLTLNDKPFMGAVTAPERAQDSIDMAKIVHGADFADKNCVIMGNINVNSPLVYDDIMSAALRTYSAENQVMVIAPFILGGAMGPVTAPGAIAQAHAEAMVGVALTQLVRKGAPVVYGNFLTSMSLKTGAPTFGQPEGIMAYLTVGQLARRLGVPLRAGGSFSSSKLADFQAGQESADSLWPALMSGANFILHAGGWLEGGLVVGFDKLLMDADRLGMMHTFFQGLACDDNGFAMDAFQEAGPGNHFLGTAHTMANYETAYYNSPISDANSFEQWRDEGEKDATKRANERVQSMLNAYEEPPIDAGIKEELEAFVAKKKESMKDSWY